MFLKNFQIGQARVKFQGQSLTRWAREKKYSARSTESRALKNNSGIPINSKIRKKEKDEVACGVCRWTFRDKILVEKSLQKKRHSEGEKKTFFGNEKYLSGIL